MEGEREREKREQRRGEVADEGEKERTREVYIHERAAIHPRQMRDSLREGGRGRDKKKELGEVLFFRAEKYGPREAASSGPSGYLLHGNVPSCLPLTFHLLTSLEPPHNVARAGNVWS